MGCSAMNIRKVALITFVTTVLGLVMPVWNAVQSMLRSASALPFAKWWLVAGLLLVVSPVAAIMPAFYFVLYRNEEPFRLSRRFRPLSLAAVLVLAVITVLGFWNSVWPVGVGGNSSVLPEARDGWDIGQIAVVLSLASNVTYLLLLIAIFQHSDFESSAAAPKWALFSSITEISVLYGGIVLVVSVFRLVVATPYTYFFFRRYSRRPEMGEMVAQSFVTLLETGCRFVAPYIVYKSMVKRREDATIPEAGGAAEVR